MGKATSTNEADLTPGKGLLPANRDVVVSKPDTGPSQPLPLPKQASTPRRKGQHVNKPLNRGSLNLPRPQKPKIRLHLPRFRGRKRNHQWLRRRQKWSKRPPHSLERLQCPRHSRPRRGNRAGQNPRRGPLSRRPLPKKGQHALRHHRQARRRLPQNRAPNQRRPDQPWPQSPKKKNPHHPHPRPHPHQSQPQHHHPPSTSPNSPAKSSSHPTTKPSTTPPSPTTPAPRPHSAPTT